MNRPLRLLRSAVVASALAMVAVGPAPAFATQAPEPSEDSAPQTEPDRAPAADPAADPDAASAAAEELQPPADPDPLVGSDSQTDDSASRTLERALQDEILRAETFLSELDALAAARTDRWTSERTRIDAAIVRAAEFAGEMQVYPAASDRMDRLFERIVAELKPARKDLSEALSALRTPVDLPAPEQSLNIRDLDVPAIAAAVGRLDRLRQEIDERRQTMKRLSEQERWDRVDRGAVRVERINGLRIQVLDRLSPAKRRRVLGITTREGIDQLTREWDQLRLSARLEWARYVRAGRNAPELLGDVFTVGTVSWTLLKCLFFVALFLYVRSRLRLSLGALRKYLHEWLEGYPGRRRVDAWIDVIRVILPWGLFLGLLWAIDWSLGEWSGRAEIALILRLAFLYGVYRLAIDVIYAVSVALARLYRLSMDEKRMAKVLRSVRTMMRMIFAILGLLLLSQRLLGNGYLYHRVVQFSWVFVLLAGFLILARWRTVIAETYLQVQPEGRLANWVERTREKRLGLFVSAAAFVILAGQALVHLGRDFMLRYDPVRRIFAFLSRRRMEKQAELTGYADIDIDKIPDSYKAAFSEEPAGDARIPAIDPRPGAERFQTMLAEWLEDKTGGSFLLSGERGVGKTTWLRSMEIGDLPRTDIQLNNRIQSVHGLVALLVRELGLDLQSEAEADVRLHDVRKILLDGPKRMVVVDLVQNLFLSKVGGYEVFEKFVTLVEDTCASVFWVCSLNALSLDHLFGVRPDLMVFRHHEKLPPWSQEQLHELIRSRNEIAGIEPVYDDLVVDAIRSSDQQTRDLKTEEAYDRLLWDYSDGNPRAALHFWLRSLVIEDERRPRVRLFRAPAPEELADLGDRSRFLLAAILVHENLTIREAAQVTRYPEAICRIQIDRMWDREILHRHRGRYRVTAHWHRAVVRTLRRGNLLTG